MPQPKRTETLERFKNGEIRLLVASDVAARGLDIQGLSHVFNFDVPYHAEDYVHRIGRTGRAGRQGRSFMLAAPEDGKSVAAIDKLIGKDDPGRRRSPAWRRPNSISRRPIAAGAAGRRTAGRPRRGRAGSRGPSAAPRAAAPADAGAARARAPPSAEPRQCRGVSAPGAARPAPRGAAIRPRPTSRGSSVLATICRLFSPAPRRSPLAPDLRPAGSRVAAMSGSRAVGRAR